jgi:hypothetical protein
MLKDKVQPMPRLARVFLMYLLTFYVPEEHLELVKAALFRKGAGKYGNYDCCSWEVAGMGQFRPLRNSTPYIGKENEITRLREYKVEMICVASCINEVLQEFKDVHPYEEPAYNVIKLENFELLI